METEKALQAHKVDEYAHNESWDRQRRPYIDRELRKRDGAIKDLEVRMDSQEKFKEQAKGGFYTLAVLISGGLLAFILHLAGVPI